MPVFVSLAAVVFVAEAVAIAAAVAVSDAGWNRELLAVTVPLTLAVMVVSSSLAAHFAILVARRVLLGGFQQRMDRIEALRSESHRQLATMIPAFSLLFGGLESQRRMVEGLRSQLLPAAEKLAGENGAARAVRAPMLNALSFASGIARDADLRLASARDLRERLGRAEQSHSALLHELRELQDVFDALPGLSAGPAPFPAEPAAAEAERSGPAANPGAAAPTQPTRPAVRIATTDALPPALRARLAQRPMDTSADGYDLGLN